jgi:hypothetical protein
MIVAVENDCVSLHVDASCSDRRPPSIVLDGRNDFAGNLRSLHSCSVSKTLDGSLPRLTSEFHLYVSSQAVVICPISDCKTLLLATSSHRNGRRCVFNACLIKESLGLMKKNIEGKVLVLQPCGG